MGYQGAKKRSPHTPCAWLTVSLADGFGAGLPTPPQLDTGAAAYAMLNARMETDTTPPAVIHTSATPTDLLKSTPDANITDPFVQQQAAKLDYDPQGSFDFLHTEIGYNSYVGSLRGARGTLWSSAGNALDVASLVGQRHFPFPMRATARVEAT
jgi:hypothetical protein